MNCKNAFFVLALGAATAACSDDFEPYDDVQGFRLLAMGADKPHLLPGESATLSALVSTDATYQWSWCPLSSGAATGYQCAVGHEDLQAFADAAFNEPITIPDYDLGSGKTATFAHDIPPDFYRRVCEFLVSGSVPDGFDVPECDDSFEIQIKLRATSGEKTITGVASLLLLLDSDAVPNQNPTASGLFIEGDGGGEIELSSSQATAMKRGVTYKMRLDVPEEASESYFGVRPGGVMPEENQESLTATWFHEGGEIDKARSAFLPGSIPIDKLRTNEWTPPDAVEHPESVARFYVVVRDGRGGTFWLAREIELVTP